MPSLTLPVTDGFTAQTLPGSVTELLLPTGVQVRVGNGQPRETDTRPYAGLVIPMTQLLAQAQAEVPWLWKDFLAPGLVTVFAAAPKAGKSTLLRYMLRQMAEEEDFLGRPTRAPSEIVLLSEEKYALAVNLARMNFNPGDKAPIMINDRYPDWSAVQRIVAQVPRDALVILDTGSGFWNLENENESGQVRLAMNPLIKAAGEREVSILFVHHTNKADDVLRSNSIKKIRGSSALAGAADITMVMGLQSQQDEHRNRRRIVSVGRLDPTDLVVEFTGHAYILLKDDSRGIAEEYDPDTPPQAVGAHRATRPAARRGPRPVKVAAAEAFLSETLSVTGATRRKDLLEQAGERGINRSALDRAATKIGVVRSENGWTLPGHNDTQDRQAPYLTLVEHE